MISDAVPPTYHREAHALANEIRYEMLVELAEGPLGVQELVERFSLSGNSVRRHVAELVGAGLIEQHQHHRAARGRPRYVYSITAAARRWLDPSGLCPVSGRPCQFSTRRSGRDGDA